MASESISTITGQNFDEKVLQSKVPVLVDFGLNGVAPVA